MGAHSEEAEHRPGEDSPASLDVVDLEVTYANRVVALAGVSLKLSSGRCLGLLGSNGAGKTTLMRAVGGLLRFHDGAVTRGHVAFGGRIVLGGGGARLRRRANLPATVVRAGIGQVMQGRRVFADLTVDDNLAAGAFLRRDRAAVAVDRARVLDLFEPLARRHTVAAGLLSGGEQQMLAIGRALMGAPRLLLLDEPSLGLAPRVVSEIVHALAQIGRGGTSLLVAEQQASVASTLADEICLLDRGRITATLPAASMADDPRVRELYLGAPS